MMKQARALIQDVLEVVYKNPRQAERIVAAYFEQVCSEVVPELDNLKVRIEKLEEMVVWAYTFSCSEVLAYDEHEQMVMACGGCPDKFSWALSTIECNFDVVGFDKGSCL